MKKIIISKDVLIKEFKLILDKHYEKTGACKITRNEYRKQSKYESAYQNYFKNFNELEKTYSINLPEKKIKSKKYLVSAIVPQSKTDEFFIEAMEKYCKLENAELILVPIRGVHKEEIFEDNIVKKYGKYFAAECKFNNNLKLINVGITANNKDPRWRMKEIGHKDSSIIIASTKQTMQTIPTLVNGKTHIIYSTGSVNDCIYNKNITGTLNKENNTKGALIVEIENDKYFYIRNIEWKNNYFVDLNKKYNVFGSSYINAECMVLGDLHFGGILNSDIDKNSLQVMQKQLKLLNPNKIVIHDLFTHSSICHHNDNDWTIKRISLEQDHQNTAINFIRTFKDFINKEFIIVKSNHDEWVNKYIKDRKKWINDNWNVQYAFILANEILNKKDPCEYALKYNLELLNFKFKQIKFLKRSDSYKIAGYELACHGDIGSSGSKGNLNNIERSVGKCVMGHTHSPEKSYMGSYCVGTLTKIPLPYASSSATSWLPASVSIYKDGHTQLLITVSQNNKFKL